jgi:hypothetical protein
VLVLPPEIYIRYVSHFYADGYMARSGGLLIQRGGYVHMAINTRSSNPEKGPDPGTLAHEFAHNAVVKLSLPRWLDEALAMSFAAQFRGLERSVIDNLSSSGSFDEGRPILEQFKERWTPERLQGFWSGKLWYSEADGEGHCYQIARLFFGILREHINGSPGLLQAFIGEAKRKDAGETSARQHLGLSLGDLASKFFGPGDWAPKPEAW